MLMVRESEQFFANMVRKAEITLKPVENQFVSWITGYYYGDDHQLPENLLGELRLHPGYSKNLLDATFVRDWKRKLPAFDEEEDAELKRELIWHTYVLEAMAQ